MSDDIGRRSPCGDLAWSAECDLRTSGCGGDWYEDRRGSGGTGSCLSGSGWKPEDNGSTPSSGLCASGGKCWLELPGTNDGLGCGSLQCDPSALMGESGDDVLFWAGVDAQADPVAADGD